MADEVKTWYTSKTIWGAVCVFIGGGLVALGFDAFGQGLLAIGAGLGFVGLRTANKPLK